MLEYFDCKEGFTFMAMFFMGLGHQAVFDLLLLASAFDLKATIFFGNLNPL